MLFSFGDYYCNDVPSCFCFGDYCNVVPFLFLSVIIAMMSLCAGRKPLREVTQLLRRMFLSTPAPVTTWAGESTFGDER